MSFEELIRRAAFFEGEFEAIESEFCGGFPVPLYRLAPIKRERLASYLKHPPEARREAFETVKSWANSPIAAATKLLENPAAFVPRGKRATMDAIREFLEGDA